MNIDIVFFELHWKFDISRTIKLENGGGLVTEPLGALFQNVRLGGGGFRVAGGGQAGCLSIAALSHSPGEFSEAHCASGPTAPLEPSSLYFY